MLLDEMPGEPRRNRRQGERDQEKLPPRRLAAQGVDHHRLHRPPIDVEAVGEVAEPSGGQDGKLPVGGEIYGEIAAKEREERNELPQRNARRQPQGREKGDPSVEDGCAAELVEHHTNGEERGEEAEGVQKVERVPLQRGKTDP